jgi:hypothetical protein
LTTEVLVYSDEDDNAPNGDVINYSPDARDLGIGTLRLRAERDPAGNGRVYLIIVKVTDSSGNVGYGATAVGVPKSNSPANQAAVLLQQVQAVAFFLTHPGTLPAGFVPVGDGPVAGPKQ